MRTLHLASLASLLLLGGACAPERGPCALAAGEVPSLQIGTGERSFEPVDDGDELGVVGGSWGGYHVWGSLRVTGVYGGDSEDPRGEGTPRLSFSVLDGEQDLSAYDVQLRILRAKDGWLVSTGEVVPLDVLALDQTLQREVLFGARVEDACGTVIEAQVGPLTLVESDEYYGG